MGAFQERFNLLYEEAKDKNYRLTQEGIAATFGATRSQLKGWLDGRGEPDTEMLKNIAKVCGVSVSWLVGETDLRIHEADKLEEDWPEIINMLRGTGKKPSMEEQRRLAKILKAAIDEY